MVAALMRLTLQWGNEKYFYCDECYEEQPGEGLRERLGISLTPISTCLKSNASFTCKNLPKFSAW